MSDPSDPKESKEKQLDLGLKHHPFNIFSKYRERFELTRARWDTRKYTKSTWVWFSITLSIALITTQIITIQEQFSLLPQEIPIFQFYIDNIQRLAPFQMIYSIPATSAMIFVFGVIFSHKYYGSEKNLSNVLLLTMFLSISIISISLIKLLNLY